MRWAARQRVGLLLLAFCPGLSGQQSYTWQQIRQKFESTNSTLRAGMLNIDESRAMEITAFLRPNPDLTTSLDQIDPFSTNPYRPLGGLLPLVSASYLHERQHKRELRLESAKNGTAIAASQQEDLTRTLEFSLRNAFIQALQAKAVFDLSTENLAYYDQLLGLSRERLKAGDISQVDLMRLELQRVQYESDVQTAQVNVRTAKIQLLALMNDRMPVEQFDVTGTFDFSEAILPLEEYRQIALAARPDLRAAAQAVDKAKADNRLAVANGSTDPTFSADAARNPPQFSAYIGFSMTIPLRIFDRNQGEKERTEIDIRRTQRLQEASTTQVFSDVDSAYATLTGNLNILRPYKAKYLDEADKVRSTISFAYQHGGASLLDFLNAQNDYRSIRLNYLNLVGSWLTAASQLNLAVGREAIAP
ncbi:MAG: TolC family protein [Acidobacteriota bacterium]|nr:TolC family protein [Acidobacteriota bacterium]